ncbi:type II toxin-antitoxin system HicB family antitoxin [Endozoicomonas sp. SCSIO W0465]|uniref:type II toxin-antitoxin system HicB family antitoxin n=1 Tax=Endozoicomonas sp. SCSIO W0465 TaxID=2918516 RepID=UPI00207650E5|nr:type II toxin-antitoxin system HicB family antitoxin [Endozoicomonas sp. SCSIO W0465]USE39244.1 type II toxin-antitoxin system HicB family antitoxin [Endozoicomonas sp. SCSIO W0465]
MINQMTINGYIAVITYDPEIDLFRGEFVGLNGGADFYAADVKSLHQEGKVSLKVFLDACKEEGIEPRKAFSGKLNLRIDPDLHESASVAAAASNRSLNQLINDALRQSLN